jgi:hypothetical protein
MDLQTKGETLSLVLLTIGWAWVLIGILGITIGIDTSRLQWLVPILTTFPTRRKLNKTHLARPL